MIVGDFKSKNWLSRDQITYEYGLHQVISDSVF